MDKMIGEAKVLRRLVEECLDDDPAVRPTIASVCERIQVSKDAYMKECPQDVITVLQQLEQSREETKLKEIEIKQLRNKNKKLKNVNIKQSSMIGELPAAIDQMVMITIASNMMGRLYYKSYSYCVLFLVLQKEFTNTRNNEST